ncbi:MAG TPA: phospholipase D family protein [Burkholderiales bacterium]|nr:phospholipase D family protein [Burkholderiales bacterium]
MKRTRPVRLYGLLLVLLLLAQPARAFESSDIVPGTGTIEYAFTPGDDAAGLIVRAIDGARFQILVQAFSFTHAEIAGALIRGERRGLDVKVIADAEQIDLIDHNVIPQLVGAGIPVFTDAEHAAAHNKVIVIDAGAKTPVLITGSFNFTHAAQFRNAENLLVLRGNHELTRAYLDNWMRHLKHSTRFRRGNGK